MINKIQHPMDVMKDHFDNLKEILHDKIGVDPDSVHLDSRLEDDLGLDSLDKAEFVIEVEKLYKIDIPEGDLYHGFVTVLDIVNYLTNHFNNERR